MEPPLEVLVAHLDAPECRCEHRGRTVSARCARDRELILRAPSVRPSLWVSVVRSLERAPTLWRVALRTGNCGQDFQSWLRPLWSFAVQRLHTFELTLSLSGTNGVVTAFADALTPIPVSGRLRRLRCDVEVFGARSTSRALMAVLVALTAQPSGLRDLFLRIHGAPMMGLAFNPMLFAQTATVERPALAELHGLSLSVADAALSAEHRTPSRDGVRGRPAPAPSVVYVACTGHILQMIPVRAPSVCVLEIDARRNEIGPGVWNPLPSLPGAPRVVAAPRPTVVPVGAARRQPAASRWEPLRRPARRHRRTIAPRAATIGSQSISERRMADDTDDETAVWMQLVRSPLGFHVFLPGTNTCGPPTREHLDLVMQYTCTFCAQRTEVCGGCEVSPIIPHIIIMSYFVTLYPCVCAQFIVCAL